MAHFPMNPYDEQRLIQEVHYLHSLWHQGPPPHPHHPPHPHPYPYLPQAHHPTPLTLHPTSSNQFKKRNNKKKKKSRKLKESEIQDSGIEWISSKSPTESPPPVNESGWPSFKPQIKKQPHLPTDQELATVEANKVQQQALKAVSEYLKYSKNANDDEDDEEYDDDDDDMEVEEEDKGEKNVSFFAKLFEEDVGLKEYYVKNSESGVGEFSCLVCCGVGKKGWKKRFKDCVALVQHSITIANAREAHRAYGKVICRVLGWDINRLPSIVLTAGDKTGESSGKLAEAQPGAYCDYYHRMLSITARMKGKIQNLKNWASRVNDANEPSEVIPPLRVLISVHITTARITDELHVFSRPSIHRIPKLTPIDKQTLMLQVEFWPSETTIQESFPSPEKRVVAHCKDISGEPQGVVRFFLPIGALPSPPPWGWSRGFITTLTTGRLLSQRLDSALIHGLTLSSPPRRNSMRSPQGRLRHPGVTDRP
ncbi:putative peptide-N4-(N-acetyl-beta-glucosaminyl)asparagine amidase A-like [Capsicum annuum]|nr:putative peptide-N4-(N-acetyl-beta-glucosaminyl)asparagine amidase A-like [Capsicum annuum]